MMSHRRSSPVIALTLLLALVAAPKSPAASFRTDPTLAQAPAAPAFKLPESVASNTIVKIDGSTSLQTINQLLKQRFQQQYSGTKVEDSYSGSDSALQSVLDGKVDLAAIGRPLTDAEKAEGLSAVPIARRKIAILVSPDNPYTGDISYEQFAKIFRGEITDWSELGGSPGPIRLIDRPDSSDTRLAFNNYPIFKSAPFETGATAVKTEDETDAVIKELGKDGVSFALVDQVLDRQDVRIVPMHKTLPTEPRYPFSQPLTYVYKGNPSPAVLAFLGFATDASNQQAIEQARATASEAEPIAASPTETISPTEAASPTAEIPSASPSEAPLAVTATDSGKDWLPWLLLPLLGGIGALLWALRGRQRPDLRAQDERVAPPRVPPLDVTPAQLADPAVSPVGAVSPVSTASPIGKASMGVGAIAAAAGAAALGRNRRDSRIILTPRTSEQAYAYWETPEAHKAELRQQGGEALKLRIYDVTDIDLDAQDLDAQDLDAQDLDAQDLDAQDLDAQVPHSVFQYDCAETDQDRHVPIAESDRNYMAEIGYVTPNYQWLMLARSAPVRVPAAPTETISTEELGSEELSPEDLTPGGLGLGAIAGGAVLATTAISALSPQPIVPEPEIGAPEIGAPEQVPPESIPPSRIVLTPRSFEEAYAYWETPEAAKAALRRQGGERLTLLLADVTDLDLRTQTPYNVQQFSCAEIETDRHLPIPVGDRDYIAEIGYLTTENQWLLLARSEPVRVPPVSPVDSSEAVDALLVDAEPVASESAIMADIDEADIDEVGMDEVGMDLVAEDRASALDEMAAGAAALGAGYAYLNMPQSVERDRPATEVARAETVLNSSHPEMNGEDLASVDENLPDLPADYGESRITLMARDPHWAYAYWYIPLERREVLQQIGGTSLALRFYDITDVDLDTQNPHSLQQYYCDEVARDWYIPVPVSDRDYIVEIGYVTSEGIWLMLARSIPVRMPPVYPSDWYEEKFTTVPWEEEIRARMFQQLVEPYRWSRSENPAYSRIFRLAEIAQEQRISGSLFGSMQQIPQASVSSFVLPTPSGISGAVTESGVGMMSGVGISGIGMSGIGMSGIGMSGIGMSGIGLLSLSNMSGVGLAGMSGVGLAGMSGIGMYTTSGVGLAGMSGIGYTMSGVGLAGMSGIGMYTTSGVGLAGMSGIGYTMSGVGLAGMSGIGYTMSGVGLAGMSGVGYTMSGVGLAGMSGIGYTMSGVELAGMSGIGYTMSGVGLAGMSGIGYTMSGVGLAGMSGIGMYTTSGVGLAGMSGIGYTMSGVGLAGMSGIGMYTTSGIGLAGMSGIGYTMSGIGLAGMSGIGYTMSGVGLAGMSGIGYTMSGVGLAGMSGIGYTMSGVGNMSGTGFANASGINMYSLSGAGLYGLLGVGMYSLSKVWV